ncbi:MAG: ABC transporter permease [Prevotella sp.]
MTLKPDIDSYREILNTLSRNKARSFLTGFGVFWGVFMLVMLLGSGQGMKDKLQGNFEGFASNSAIIFAQPTSKPYAGYRKGRKWNMVYKDVERIKSNVKEVETASPIVSKKGTTAIFEDKKYTGIVKGLMPDYSKVEKPKLLYGRYLNEMDIKKSRKVCVIGKQVYEGLFSTGENPCGKKICIDKVYYNIIGVDVGSTNININGRAEETICVPLSVMQSIYNIGDVIHMICLTSQPGITMESITQKLREVIANAHHVSPDDEKSIMVFNTEVMFGMLDNLFSGVNFLILLVGIGTLLAGAIGVSNIMMVTVKERTVEIGIRRAIGAVPGAILWQIISESLVLTIVAGMSGIVLAVSILEMIELANTTNGILSAHFQITFGKALLSVMLLCMLGIVAGLIPALRAMKIKPVDAMRDE